MVSFSTSLMSPNDNIRLGFIWSKDNWVEDALKPTFQEQSF